MRYIYILGFIAFLILANYTHCKKHGSLSGVLLSAEKDIPILGKVLRSVLENLDLSLLYVVVPGRKYESLKKQYFGGMFHRVRMVNEDWLRIPISKMDVKPIMVESARRAGIYRNLSKQISVPDGKGKRKKLVWEPPSELETFIDDNAQWYWQQLVKLLIGKALPIKGDYVVLDGDVVWYRNIQLLQSCPSEAAGRDVPDFYSADVDDLQMQMPHPTKLCRYHYTTSAQYHQPYLYALAHLLGINLLQSGSALAAYSGFGRQDLALPYPAKDGQLHVQHISGVAHHMVFVRPVLDSMLNHIEAVGGTRCRGAGRERIRTSRSGDSAEQERNGFHHRYLSPQNVSYAYSETADHAVLTFDSRYTADSITDPSYRFDAEGRRTVAEEILEYAASALVCGPTTLCDKLQTVSEYELYFQYARIFFPSTISLRALLWANGPQPGLLYWPTLLSTVPLLSRIKQWWGGDNDAKPPILLKGQLHSKKLKDYYDVREEENWLDGGNSGNSGKSGTDPGMSAGSKRPGVVFSPKQRHFFDMQIMADKAQGYHFVAYHSHAKQRRFELRPEDVIELCTSGNLQPSEELYTDKTCSFIGKIDNTHTMHLDVDAKMLPLMFKGCACSDLMQILFRS